MTRRSSLQPERLETDPPGFDPVFTPPGSQYKNGCMVCPLKTGRCTHPCSAAARGEANPLHPHIMTNQNHLERFRPSMSGDVLKSWAADAQAEIDRLSKPASTPAIVAAMDALTMAASFLADLNSAHGNTEGQGVREACGKALAGLVELLPGMEIAPCMSNMQVTDAFSEAKRAYADGQLQYYNTFYGRWLKWPAHAGEPEWTEMSRPAQFYRRAGHHGADTEASAPIMPSNVAQMARALVYSAEATPGTEIPVQCDDATPPHKVLAEAQSVAIQRGLADRYVSFYTPAGASVMVTAQA